MPKWEDDEGFDVPSPTTTTATTAASCGGKHV